MSRRGMGGRQLAFRLPQDLIDRLMKHVQRMNKTIPGHQFTAADAVRMLLTQALDTVESARRNKR